MGDSIQAGNVEGVGIAIGTGAAVNIHGDIHYYPIKLRAPLRAVFRPLIDHLSGLFGGRARAFREIADFIRRPRGGYFVVTAPAGFGKTALMANLVSNTPEAFAYHFFTPLYGDDTLTELFFLRNVVEQMALWHEHDEELPERINDLRALFHRFVDEPLDRTQVLVIDGLDEVMGWRLEPYLSRPLPEHLHVIASVRDVGQDWRGLYGFPADQTLHLPLEGLDRDEVADVLRAVGRPGAQLAGDDELLSRVCEIVNYEADGTLGADPFYARYLAEDVRDGVLHPANLSDQPRGLEAYLDRWWQQIKKLAGDAPTRDLFGTLAVALGPIRRDDLEAANPSLVDDWAGDFFLEVLDKVRRMVMGNAEQGYALVHPRLRLYLADTKRIGKIGHYRDRLVDFCAKWRSRPSHYAMNHFAAHLAEAGAVDDLYRLFDGEWIAAQWNTLGTYARLVGDLDIAMRAHRETDVPDYTRVTAMAVARQTARELMLGFPIELLKVWIQLGRFSQVLATVNTLGSTKGRAAEPLAIVARELLLRQTQDGAEDNGRLAGTAAELLTRAVDLLPRVRSAGQTTAAIACIARALEAGGALSPATRERLVDATLEFLGSTSDATLHAVGIGLLAEAVITHEDDRDRGAQLLKDADRIRDTIDFTPDRVAVEAYLLPVAQKLAPGGAMARLAALLDNPDALLEHSSLLKNPLVRLVKKWRPTEEADRGATVGLLEALASLPGEHPDYEYAAVLVSAIVEHLLELGLVDRAIELIEHLSDADPQEGARVVLSVCAPLFDAVPERAQEWLDGAVDFMDYRHHPIAVNREFYTAQLGEAFATVGKWDRASEILGTVRARERVGAVESCMRIAGERFPHEPSALVDRVDSLLSVVDEAEPEHLAKTYAVAATVLMGPARSRARRLAAKATALCLADMPEGSTDHVRYLQAVAHHLEGDYVRAVGAATSMKWISATAECLTFLMTRCGNDADAIDDYATGLLDTLRAGRHRSLYSDAIVTAAKNQPALMRQRLGAAAVIDEYLLNQSVELSVDHFVRCRAALAASVTPLDPERGAQRFLELVGRVEGALEAGYEISAAVIGEIYRQLASVAGDLDSAVLNALDPLEARFEEDAKDRFEISCTRAELLAAVDCEAAAGQLSALVGGLDTFRNAPPQALYLSRMIADFTGRRVGPRMQLVDAANKLGWSLGQCASRCPEPSMQLLGNLLDEILTIDDSPEDLAQALANTCNHCAAVPEALGSSVAALMDRVIDVARALPAELVEHVISAAIQALIGLGQIAEARSALDKLGEQPWREQFDHRVDIAQERLALGTPSTFDEAFANLVNRDLAVVVLHAVRVDKESAEIVHYLGDSFAEDRFASERGRLLGQFVPLLAAPLLETGASAAIAALAEEIEAFDSHFHEAARRIGEFE